MTDIHELTHDLRSFAVLGLVDQVYDTGPQQLVDVTINNGVQHTQVPVMQMAGLASAPALGGVVLIINIGGDPANMRALPIVSTWRFGNLALGEAVLYGADGTRVACRADGHMDILARTTINMQAPAGVDITGPVSITGNLTVTGEITGTEDIADAHGSMEAMRQAYNPHEHGASGPPTPLMPD